MYVYSHEDKIFLKLKMSDEIILIKTEDEKNG